MPESTLTTVITFNSLALLLPILMIVLYRKPDFLQTALSIFAGFLIGMINLRSNEVQFPVLLLLSFGFFVGFSRREHAWMRALLLAMWVPLGQCVEYVLHLDTIKFGPEVIGSLMAFVPAFIGVYSGVLLGSKNRLAQQTA